MASFSSVVDKLGDHQAPRNAARRLLRPVRHLDILSRYVVGWTVAALDRRTFDRRRGTASPTGYTLILARRLTSTPVAAAGRPRRAQVNSRPHELNDNMYSVAAFKTLKYAPVFPDRFGSLSDARSLLPRHSSLLQPRSIPLMNRLAHPSIGPRRHRCFRSAPVGPRPWTPPAPPIPTDSPTDPSRHGSPKTPGSTNPSGRPPIKRTNAQLSQPA